MNEEKMKEEFKAGDEVFHENGLRAGEVIKVRKKSPYNNGLPDFQLLIEDDEEERSWFWAGYFSKKQENENE